VYKSVLSRCKQCRPLFIYQPPKTKRFHVPGNRVVSHPSNKKTRARLLDSPGGVWTAVSASGEWRVHTANGSRHAAT